MKRKWIVCLMLAIVLLAGCASSDVVSPVEAQKAAEQEQAAAAEMEAAPAEEPAAEEAAAEPAEEAAAEPAEEAAAEPATEAPVDTSEMQLFPWAGHTLRAASVQDDDTVKCGTSPATGRFIKLTLDCLDGTLTWEEISGKYHDFTLRDEAGNDYEPVGGGMKTVDGASFNIEAVESTKFAAMQPIFDIPAEMALSELTLRVPSDLGANATIVVKLADIPLYVAEE